MISIILVSHSKKITDGLKEMIEEMVDSTGDVKIYSAGGTEDGRLGTDSVAIYNIIEQSKDHKNILIFADIGSAILSTETAIDLIEDEALRSKVTLVDAPLVEGAFVASIQAMVDEDVEGILAELQNI
ncbi:MULTISPECIES: dihydroxyacetone kinase phosphoryl donor subunit DhaM [unclassified Gilliamella]|uniref:dihydroxyacetone kinase phosphoryl donor subunit DhaM n=1 Tax=unclassified Gilliamella TaxID=2685620 RepID=UPI00226A068F|nr:MULTISPECIES: dihydroxyacetone kinase phosphoryl donor subunit DhaM [unclassified Gilliamella]MCX8642281.1 PTS-dependent dihydroxyacetone kinase phosphotransferase subunit DhaM [Gilliamella sp. B3835]MCX8707679.1 PTS-dependent dihydroxyacetone kinase phosphotransferase subunit DhaM [Gilliamella sp. B3783]MCX8709994.1 PTS-dependent dihydroxyacetone kinase phosphotransferase subunit DhaM [Gilliamella sp. B3780]MCX8712791.1 PTS-dependent dihydroxyacetone kinase phosphotransferase subunit DhaM [